MAECGPVQAGLGSVPARQRGPRVFDPGPGQPSTAAPGRLSAGLEPAGAFRGSGQWTQRHGHGVFRPLVPLFLGGRTVASGPSVLGDLDPYQVLNRPAPARSHPSPTVAKAPSPPWSGAAAGRPGAAGSGFLSLRPPLSGSLLLVCSSWPGRVVPLLPG